MNSSYWFLDLDKWIILLSVVCHLNEVMSCRTFISNPSELKASIDKMLGRNYRTNNSKINSFSDYLLIVYNQKVAPQEIDFIFEKWTEFNNYKSEFSFPLGNAKSKHSNIKMEMKHSCLNDNIKTKVSEKKKKKRQNIILSTPPSLSLLQTVIENRKETNLILNVKAHYKRKIRHKSKYFNHRIFSHFEANLARNATQIFSLPNHGPCRVQQVSICMEKYFSLQTENHDLIHFYPPSISVDRCSQNKCLCMLKTYECLPSGTVSRDHCVIGIDQKQLPWTWGFFIIDHIGCKCQPRCQKRKCIRSFYFTVYYNEHGEESCKCECVAGKERQCKEILNGHRRFSTYDYLCIISGKCLKPKCTVRPISEENLYNRRCPTDDDSL